MQIASKSAAMVFILLAAVNFENSPVFNKDKFGRLQEFEAGFNYEIPYEEFSKMFTSKSENISH